MSLSVRETLEKSFALDKPGDQAHNHKANWTTWAVGKELRELSASVASKCKNPFNKKVLLGR